MCKEDCFFYNKKDCRALKELYCKKEEECSFYKTQEQEVLDRIKYGYNLKVEAE